MLMQLMDDIFLKFQGFRPSKFTRSHLGWIVRELHEKAPYGARVRASISHNAKVFKGTIQITSEAGSFFATASGNKVKEVGKSLMDQIDKQLDKWKSLRFLPDANHPGELVTVEPMVENSGLTTAPAT